MFIRLVFSLLALTAGPMAMASEPCKEQPCTVDSAAVVEAIHTLEPWIGEQINALHTATNPAEVRTLANALHARTDSLARRFRETFPDNDDGWSLFGLYSGMAAAYGTCAPALAAVYNTAAVTALYSGTNPYRPDMYQALQSISDRAWQLARARNPQRAKRLLEKLDADRVDLVLAL
ncbi:MAG: hypothetical protein RBT71_07170 [Flavobacteriales bacterium]|jgi:hypothetical protein|nr:hypothetical protein [Flavobacteriales bacterium]